MKKENKHDVRIIVTADGSHSLYHENLHETYHSTHGAYRESMHVFIENGLRVCQQKNSSIGILEIGFGTGLNALLTYVAARNSGHRIEYTTLEPFPLPIEISSQLSFGCDDESAESVFRRMHSASWETEEVIDSFFNLHKVKSTLQNYHSEVKFELVYYDAFGPPAQPEMWTREVLQHTFDMMSINGILVTYCAKGQVRRDLQACGFQVERLPGPPGKREMLRATKS